MSKQKHNQPWTELELARMRKCAAVGMSARQTGAKLGRTTGATKYKAMVVGIRFHAIEQPAGAQKKLGRLRRKIGMHAVLRRRAA